MQWITTGNTPKYSGIGVCLSLSEQRARSAGVWNIELVLPETVGSRELINSRHKSKYFMLTG